jgi:hypothetical protein
MKWILEHMSAFPPRHAMKVKLDLGTLRADANCRTRLFDIGVRARIYIKWKK